MVFYKKYIEMEIIFIEFLLEGDQTPIVSTRLILMFLLLL